MGPLDERRSNEGPRSSDLQAAPNAKAQRGQTEHQTLNGAQDATARRAGTEAVWQEPWWYAKVPLEYSPAWRQ